MPEHCSSSEATALPELAVIDTLLEPFDRGDAPGLVVGIARNNGTVYRRGVGLGSIEHGVANTPQTRMRIGSATKSFTCLAVLRLAEKGLLAIDDPVRRHLPELPELGSTGPTLRQLMNHTGGWRCNLSLSLIANGFAVQPKGSALRLLARQRELNFEPGSRMIYSNGGYHLLAKVIERISGQSFEQFMAEHVFGPLGMADTESVPSDFDIRAGLATLYQALPASEGGGWRRGIFPSEELGGEGGMISTLDDMLRWLAELRGGAKGSGTSTCWAQMLEPTQLSTGAAVSYGLGLMRHRYRGVEVVHHAGGVIGGAAQMLTVPEHDLDIIIMTNGAPLSPSALAFKMIDALLADKLIEPAEEGMLASAYPALLGQRYHARASGAVVGFGEVAGKLALSWMNFRFVPLRREENTLRLGTEDIAINPIEIDASELGGDTAPASLALAEGGNVERFERLPVDAPTGAALAPQLVGNYSVDDLDASAAIRLDGDTLMLLVQGAHGRQELRLQPLSPEVLACDAVDPLLAALGAGCILNVDRRAGQVAGLRLDNLRTRHLHFVREATPA